MNNAVAVKDEVSPLFGPILKALIYFDIFNYPLTQSEILSYCPYSNPALDEIRLQLERLVTLNMIRKEKQFYFLAEDNSLIERRIKGNALAEKYLKRAKLFSALIARFPFVKSVSISGSLSKGYMDADSDIDYFVITAENRVWLCRTFLMLFKKIFLFNSRKFFCINYFIDSSNLEINDKNLYTATELATLIPVYPDELFSKFIESNKWHTVYYPNKKSFNSLFFSPRPDSFVKKFAERMFDGKLGTWLDEFCLGITVKYWKNKFKTTDEKTFEMNFRSGKNISKHHPNSFQVRVLECYQQKTAFFESKFNTRLGR
jgi:hypothetical protein